MNWSYIKIAWRNISKKKIQNLINLIGLICGITFIMLVGAYIWDAHQVNSQLRNKDQQYILQSSYKKEGIGLPLTTIGALPKALYEEYPHLIANYYRIDGLTCIVSNGTDSFEEGVSLGDPSILSMYGFSLFEGNPQTALTNPFTVVLSEDAAKKYFGSVDVIGKELTISNFEGKKHAFLVTGVIKSNYQNSVLDLTPSMHSDVFLPISSEKFFGRDIDQWANVYIAGFLELQEGVNPQQLEEPIKRLVQNNTEKAFYDNYTAQLKPLKTYYLEDNNGAIKKMVNILIYIAGFILLMAIINFINFSIAQNISRLKEIGVRKIMGARSTQIALLLLTEYVLLVLSVLLICIPLYGISKPLFENILLRKLPGITELPIYFYVGLVGLSLFIGLFSGLYPAIKLSKNGILKSVKYQLDKIKNKQNIQKALLLIQFTVAMIILTSTVIISKQIQLFIDGNLGYNKDYLMTLRVPRDWSVEGVNKILTIRQELSGLPEVVNSSISYETPNNIVGKATISLMDNSKEAINTQMITSDSFFGETYQIPLLAGKFFSSNITDTSRTPEVVLNKEAMESLGFVNPNDIIGKNILLNDGTQKAIVVGVTENFIANSMHSPNTSVIWTNLAQNTFFRYISIRLKPGSIAANVQVIEKKWKELLSDAPFQFQFMEDSIKKMYKTELQLQRASVSATIIALIIVSLGIMGLVSLAINARGKEVGMRKILGASLSDLLILFSKEYYLIFIVSIITAIPISYILIKKWLENYEYRIDLTTTMFIGPLLLLAGLLGGIIMLVLFRSTRFNPIDKLREE